MLHGNNINNFKLILNRKKSKTNSDVDFFHDNGYFSDFINIELVSIPLNIAISVSITIIQPTSTAGSGIITDH